MFVTVIIIMNIFHGREYPVSLINANVMCFKTVIIKFMRRFFNKCKLKA